MTWTVKELVQELQQLPEDWEVIVAHPDTDWFTQLDAIEPFKWDGVKIYEGDDNYAPEDAVNAVVFWPV